jgi:hypothetical protein
MLSDEAIMLYTSLVLAVGFSVLEANFAFVKSGGKLWGPLILLIPTCHAPFRFLSYFSSFFDVCYLL